MDKIIETGARDLNTILLLDKSELTDRELEKVRAIRGGVCAVIRDAGSPDYPKTAMHSIIKECAGYKAEKNNGIHNP